MKRMLPNIYVTDCRQAIDFYVKIFNAQVTNTMCVQNNSRAIISAELKINDSISLNLSRNYSTESVSNACSFILEIENQDEMLSLYHRLCEDCDVITPLQKTLRGTEQGGVRDIYGITWLLIYPPHEPTVIRR